MSAPDLETVPLRIPAILQNPVNRTQKQVEAHNAQQREKVEAKREREKSSRIDTGGKGDRRGKRVIRRVDNASFTSNPHIVRPSKSDYYPSYPLNPRPPLPLKSLARSAAIPSTEIPAKDPFSTSSVNGTFSTSLKGIRQALKKKGRRTEVVVQRVEGELRGWLGGKGVLGREGIEPEWREVDETLVEDVFSPTDEEKEGEELVSITNGRVGSRRMPERHRLQGSLPPLPIVDGMIPAILELSRSAGHLTWMAVEGFERLVIHLICRYYEVVSWSEDHVTTSGQRVRLTHIIRPAITKPRPAPTGVLFTPENSDLSAPPSSDSSNYSTDNDSDTATEMGESMPDSDFHSESEVEMEGYSLVSSTQSLGPDGFENLSLRSPTLETAMGEIEISTLSLGRTYSNSSSQYAESEGESDIGAGTGPGMADSLTLPPMPSAGGLGWVSTFQGGPVALGALPVLGLESEGPKRMNGNGNGNGNGGRSTWEDKPTFFEYLYGA